MNKCIFLDRDGTINVDVSYLKYPEDLKLIEGSAQAIKLFHEDGFKVIVVTNQSGVARGYFTEDDVGRVNSHLSSLLKEKGTYIDDVFYCPHYEQGKVKEYSIDCSCRKPKPGMVFSAAQKYDLDLSACFVIGDKESDIQLGRTAGCKTVLVLTGDGKKYADKTAADFIAEDLLDAYNKIKK